MISIVQTNREAQRLAEIEERDFREVQSEFNACWKRLRDWIEGNPSFVCPPGFTRVGSMPHALAELGSEIGKTTARRNALLDERARLRMSLGIDR